MSIRCTECGQLGAEGANYCQRCGALLVRPEGAGGPATAAFRLDEDTGDRSPDKRGLVGHDLDLGPRWGGRPDVCQGRFDLPGDLQRGRVAVLEDTDQDPKFTVLADDARLLLRPVADLGHVFHVDHPAVDLPEGHVVELGDGGWG